MRFAVLLLPASLLACSGKSTGPSGPPNASALIYNTTSDALRLTWSLSPDLVQPASPVPANGSATIGSHQQKCVRMVLPSIDGSTGWYELELFDDSFSSPVLVGVVDITPTASFEPGGSAFSSWTFSGVGNYGGYLYLQPAFTGSLC